MATSDQSSSFRKKARIKAGQIQGTRPSLYNNQLLISTGIPSLDNVIGGGLAVGTVLLVEEDTFGSYSRLILKYFLGEAVVTKQHIFLASADERTEKITKELPAPVDMPASSSLSNTPSQEVDSVPDKDEKMKIAWRYQNQQKVQASSGLSQFGHYYDLTKTMDSSMINESSVSYGPQVVLDDSSVYCSSPPHMNKNYSCLLANIKDKIHSGGFSTTQQTDTRSILRIGIHSLGSPLWGEGGGIKPDSEGGGPDASLTLFLIALRAELRSAFATALITIPTHLFQDQAFVRRIQRHCDSVIRIESFAGSEKEKNPVFKDYHGLVHVEQLPRLNSLIPAQLEIPDLAFKLRRKKFIIERLHLPPELSGSAPESSGVRCGPSSSSSKLEF